MNAINLKINELAIRFFDGNNSKFAKAMATSEANIRNYRKDTVPKLDFVMLLCKKLKISYEWLLSDVVDIQKIHVVEEQRLGYGNSDKDLLIATQKKLINQLEHKIEQLHCENAAQKKYQSSH